VILTGASDALPEAQFHNTSHAEPCDAIKIPLLFKERVVNHFL